MASVSSTGGTGKGNSVGTTYLDGLASGINTTDVITQLAAIQSRPITSLTAQKSALTEKLTMYQVINAALAAAKIAASDLKTTASFMDNSVTVAGYTGESAPLIASATSAAERGAYEITVEHLASAHKLASATVADADAALGSAGDIRVNGKTIALEATDTLEDLRDKINRGGVGVTATVLHVSDTDHRLMLTAGATGTEAAIDLVDANETGILKNLGLLDGTDSLKHTVAGGNGAQSDGAANSALEVAEALGLTIPPQGTVLIQGVAVAIDLSQDSLEGIRDRISENTDLQAANVTATIVSEEGDSGTVYRLQISKSDGPLTLTDDPADDGNVLQALGFVKQGVAHQIQAAQDSEITVDGITVNRATNSVDDVLSGVSIELVSAEPGQAFTLSVEPNIDSVITRVQSFVNGYNNVVNKIANAQSYDTEDQEGGVLFGDLSILHLEDGLRRSLTSMITVPGGDGALLSSIGITTNASDQLVLNTVALREALAEDPNAVANLFGLRAEASSNEISYVSGSAEVADTGASGFAVHIDQAATRATTQSRAFAGGITTDEILTFDGTRQVTLTSGMTLEQARDHLNGWFQTYDTPYVASVGGSPGEQRLEIRHEQYGSAYQVSVVSSLDQGAGGTDLGGALHGEASVQSGTDVAGTINGEACTGAGQYLTGIKDNTTTSELKLKITAATTGDIGTIVLAEGAAHRFSDYVSFVQDPDTGSMAQGAKTITEDQEDIAEEIKRVEARVQTFIDTMRARFTTMETILAKAQTLQDYMAGQISSLASNSS